MYVNRRRHIAGWRLENTVRVVYRFVSNGVVHPLQYIRLDQSTPTLANVVTLILIYAISYVNRRIGDVVEGMRRQRPKHFELAQ